MPNPERVRGKCEYCGKRIMVNPKTRFCRQCEDDFIQTFETHFDGDLLGPLTLVMNKEK